MSVQDVFPIARSMTAIRENAVYTISVDMDLQRCKQQSNSVVFYESKMLRQSRHDHLFDALH